MKYKSKKSVILAILLFIIAVGNIKAAFLYCDTLINSDLYSAFYENPNKKTKKTFDKSRLPISPKIFNHFLRKHKTYRCVVMKRDSSLTTIEAAKVEGRHLVGSGNKIALDEIIKIALEKDNNIKDFMVNTIGSFLFGSVMIAGYEGIAMATRDKDFDKAPVIVIGALCGVWGGIDYLIRSNTREVYFLVSQANN